MLAIFPTLPLGCRTVDLVKTQLAVIVMTAVSSQNVR